MFKKILPLFLLLAMFSVPVYASAPREIQYSHALSRAITRSLDISPLERESRAARALADELRDQRANLPNLDNEEADELYGQRLAALAEAGRLQREADAARFQLELRLRNQLAAIAGIESNIALLENNLVLQERMMEQMELRHYHGMVSEAELRETEHTVEQTKLNLEMLQLNLQNERQNLNRLIHQPITANIRVVYDVNNLEPIPENIREARQIQRMVAQDHDVQHWQEQVSVRRHEWQSQLNDPEVNNTRYRRMQHQLATLERNIAERQAELNVRNNLTEWERLLEEEQAALADLAQAQADYEDMQNRLEAGFVTQIQVDMVAMGLAAQESALASLSYDFWIARLRVERPYMR